MTLPDPNELAKVIDLCRKKGVKVFQMGELRLELGDEPVKKPRKALPEAEREPDAQDPWANFPTDTLNNEQLAFYSAGGKPGEEPWLNKGES
jgi:hypothetical protein